MHDIIDVNLFVRKLMRLRIEKVNSVPNPLLMEQTDLSS